ncbi:hypothetical protein SIN8267_02479 [Sinobacterium norvegicum]|uniref:Dienelactone hydrolase domain-containing protein n=1 Tax=Sinobacterium norvegicum TaxID=1641715 RepID=A0ABM9AGM2_9GAMM|nr:dienelactone hydrolase family protein [Sinobacterium norvegicum]CAH0992360.1 hypothetical protein SIN8267_02479 [Sinobacterium norvegicum]
MKKFVIAVVAIVAVVAGLLQVEVVRNGIVAMGLPDFPDWPEPQATLRVGDSGKIYYPTATPFDLDVIFAGMTEATPTTGLGYFSMPQNVAPNTQVPAMILLPGSGGIAPGREQEYAAFLNTLGIAAFVVEYYEPRGLIKGTNYIVRVSGVTEFDIISDAYSALKLLASHPQIDDQRIGVMGFSYGGMATRLAMDDRFRQQLAPQSSGFALHVDVYGPCFQNLNTGQTNGAPLLTLRGTEDKSNDLAACKLREQEMRNIGVDVETHIYQGAGHAWENFAPREMKDESPYLSGCEISYDEQGLSYLNGERIMHYPADASRVERITKRLSSSDKFSGCLDYGYIVGNDKKTKQQAYSDVQAFLTKHFF